MSLKGRKQQKYADRFDAELYRYSVWESDLKKVYPKKFPTVKQLEDYIEKLRGKLSKKNAEYVTADQKSRELSRAAREIEVFLHQKQSRDQQKKRKRTTLNDVRLFGERKYPSELFSYSLEKLYFKNENNSESLLIALRAV